MFFLGFCYIHPLFLLFPSNLPPGFAICLVIPYDTDVYDSLQILITINNKCQSLESVISFAQETHIYNHLQI